MIETGTDPTSKTPEKGEQPITILLVDDDSDCRMLVRDALSDSKVQNRVFEVGNADEAWKFLHREGEFADVPRPVLIYLDIEMPGTDGITLLKRIKSDPALRDITTVMMTGVDDAEHMRLAAEVGANSYTVKPIDAQEFMRTVFDSTNYWLRIHRYPGSPPDKR